MGCTLLGAAAGLLWEGNCSIIAFSAEAKHGCAQSGCQSAPSLKGWTCPRCPTNAAAPCDGCVSRTCAEGLEVSRIIKGCWQLSGGHEGDRATNRTKGQAAIDDFQPFVLAGITTFDTGGRCFSMHFLWLLLMVPTPWVLAGAGSASSPYALPVRTHSCACCSPLCRSRHLRPLRAADWALPVVPPSREAACAGGEGVSRGMSSNLLACMLAAPGAFQVRTM